MNTKNVMASCPEKSTLKECVEMYLNYSLNVRAIKESTYSNYAHRLNLLVKYVGGNYEVSRIAQSDFMSFCSALSSSVTRTPFEKKVMSRTTYIGYMRTYKSFFYFLSSQGIQGPKPAWVGAISNQKGIAAKEIVTDEEVATIREILGEPENIFDYRNRAFIEMLLATGIRVGELVFLTRRDMDIKGRIVVSGKNEKSRMVFLSERGLDILKEYVSKRKDTNPYLFAPHSVLNIASDMNGKPLHRSSLNQIIKDVCFRAGVTIGAHPHAFRHYFARTCAKRGVPMVVIQQLLGHSDVKVTSRYLGLPTTDLEEMFRLTYCKHEIGSKVKMNRRDELRMLSQTKEDLFGFKTPIKGKVEETIGSAPYASWWANGDKMYRDFVKAEQEQMEADTQAFLASEEAEILSRIEAKNAELAKLGKGETSMDETRLAVEGGSTVIEESDEDVVADDFDFDTNANDLHLESSDSPLDSSIVVDDDVDSSNK